jgi:alpha,alpha-trehalase
MIKRSGLVARSLLWLALVAQPALAGPAAPLPPRQVWGELFTAVETARIYPDSKTFADAIPKAAPAVILKAYRAAAPASPEALRRFVEANFTLPPPPSAGGTQAAQPDLVRHIDALWSELTRETPTAPAGGSLLPLPRPYVVPGGRFHEVYYWDSYFTMLGLARSGRAATVRDMDRDFAHLIDAYGHIPNGNRTYYLSRSQPPFFFAMAGLSSPGDPAAGYAAYLPQLKKEYAFWMEGADRLRPGEAHRRVVRLADGAVLNRYWDDQATPRDESYLEDVTLAKRAKRESSGLYRDVRAAAESGWDFSSRWLTDPHDLASIDTTEIAPVDLNSLLFGLETAISQGCQRARQAACSHDFAHRAAQRRAAVNRHMWDEAQGRYVDYRWRDGRGADQLTAASLYPLFVDLADDRQAARLAQTVRGALAAPGGLATTTVHTGQQWDAPNGWAPLQWIAVSGFRRHGQPALAEAIACRWVANVARVYRETGKLEEKYDVNDIGRPGGGGEYPAQDGFGWTNGVTRELAAVYAGASGAWLANPQAGSACPAP